MNVKNTSNRIWFSIIFLCFSVQRIQCIKNSRKRCEINEFQSGCIDRIGSQCDTETRVCVCKPDYTIKLGDYCLQPKFIDENCYVSVQCNHIPNAGCYNYREEFTYNPSNLFGSYQIKWPSGKCRCKNGHTFELNTNTCVKRIIGSWCSNVWDCRQEDKRVISPYNCENSVCECSADYKFNQTTNDCHYIETYGMVCEGNDKKCTSPTLCIEKKCQCPPNHYLDVNKTPKCQPNHNLNDVKSEGSLDVAKGDKTFEIFILTVIPLIIIFLTLKPCLKKFGKCKPQTDEVIRGSKEISIKCTDFDKDMAHNQHKTLCEKLQTIEEVGEDIKLKDGEEVIVDQVVVKDNNEGEEDKTTDEEKSIENAMTEDNGVNETTISMECSADS